MGQIKILRWSFSREQANKLVLIYGKHWLTNLPVNATADILTALADGRRRQIFEMLSEGPLAVAEIAWRLPVSRPAVSQHLKVLSDAGLVSHRVVGTRHVYRMRAEGLAGLRAYLDRLWQRALGDFKDAAERGLEPGQE